VDPRSASMRILGIPVTPFESLDAAVVCARERMTSGCRTICAAINPEKIQRATIDPVLKRALDESDFRICDGVGVALAALLLHGKKLARCTGVDLFLELTRVAACEQRRIFLLGGTSESNAGARRKLLEQFPTINVSGWCDGYFKDSQAVVEQINASGADMLFVALGSPRQELWIAEHLSQLRPVLIMGVGGSFDVLSGTARRAPIIFRRTGTEWLFRLMMDPRRIRRQFALPAFAMRVVREKLGSRI